MMQKPKPPEPLPRNKNILGLATQMPKDVLPDTFPIAQTTNVGVNPGIIQKRNRRAIGYYAGRPFSTDAYYGGATEKEATDPNPMIWLSRASDADTKMHELGHSIWYNDMHPDTQNAWAALHQAELKRPLGPIFFKEYADVPSHSFAEAWSYYSTVPELLKRLSPATYAFLKNISKFEYSRNPNRR